LKEVALFAIPHNSRKTMASLPNCWCSPQ
jgi:hypothetical protein